MVFSSVAIADDSTNHDVNKSQESRASVTEAAASKAGTTQHKFQPSAFTDAKGNLKFVNLVVAYPCSVFSFILGMCLVAIISLSSTAFAEGSPFTPDDSTYDLFDKRSVAFDSLQLAKAHVRTTFGINVESEVDGGGGDEGSMSETKLQEMAGDITYWIYEAKTDKGLFTKEALPIMRSSEVMFTKQKQYPSYCLLEYSDDEDDTPECMQSRSVTNIFYASEWNSTIARAVISELTGENIQLYNSIADCVEYNYLCQYISSDVTEEDMAWARNLSKSISSMMPYWDGEGELNDDVEEVSSFMAAINELHTKAPFVNFFFDGNFTMNNPIAMYSRSIVFWGSPLEGAKDEAINSKQSSRGLLKK